MLNAEVFDSYKQDSRECTQFSCVWHLHAAEMRWRSGWVYLASFEHLWNAVFLNSCIITMSGCSGWWFSLAWFGHLSWLVHSSSVATLIQTSTPIWGLQRLFIWLYSINNAPYTHTPAHTFIKPWLIVITMREVDGGWRRKTSRCACVLFHLNACTLSFLRTV